MVFRASKLIARPLPCPENKMNIGANQHRLRMAFVGSATPYSHKMSTTTVSRSGTLTNGP
jgi:hypothetical protein